MLPGTGITELSTSPSRISPGPPRCRSQRKAALVPEACVANARNVEESKGILAGGRGALQFQTSLSLGPRSKRKEYSILPILRGCTHSPAGDTCWQQLLKRQNFRDRNRFATLAHGVPARVISKMRKQGMNTGQILWVAEVEFVFPVFARDGVHGAHADGFYRIGGGLVRQPQPYPGIIPGP